MSNFDDLGLSKQTLAAVNQLGYTSPTPVQEQAIPVVLEGRDLIAAAKTGTGKTAAFSLPTMDRLGHAKGTKGPRMLVVTPTRELAQQIGEVCETIAHSTNHRVLTVVGGLSYDPQIRALKRGIDVLIATPGRLVDLMDQGAAHLKSVQVLVLDEADRMLDMGFWPQMKKIVAACPQSRQTLLFSATIDSSITKSVGKLLDNPATVEIAHKGETADTIDQYIIHVQQPVKPALLKGLLAERGHKRVIVFTRTRSRADATCRRLKKAGYTVEAIHSSRTQNQRRRALDNFADGTTDILVATDVLARGIDVDGVEYVVNYDLPTQAEDYIHRIGRTGRAGHTGFSVSFVSPDTEDALRDIQKLLKRTLDELKLDSFDMDEAEANAQARAARADARRDPEIQQAKKEVAKRRRKKEKAREAALEVGEGKRRNGRHSSKNTSSSGPNTSQKAHNKKRSGTKAKAQPAKRAGSHSQNRNSQGRTKAKSGASHNTAGGDFRPGRAHRAAVASRQGRRR